MSAPEEVYEAAARAREDHNTTVMDLPGRRYGWQCSCGAGRAPKDAYAGPGALQEAADELRDHLDAVIVDSAYSAGVAAGRAQAAADIRASIESVADYVWDASAPQQREIAARIAGGEPRG